MNFSLAEKSENLAKVAPRRFGVKHWFVPSEIINI